MSLRTGAAALAAIGALLLMPAAAAHTTIHSADGRVRGSVGLLNEPVSTYAVTGLDVCFTQNTTASPRPAIAVAAANFTATLRAPDGATHTADLEVPFGRPNCLTFADPLVLTRPGQYMVDLQGTINGTTFAVSGVKAGGEVVDRSALTFPDRGVAGDRELQAQVAALQVRVEALENEADEGGSEFAPGAPAAVLLVGLAALAALRRRA